MIKGRGMMPWMMINGREGPGRGRGREGGEEAGREAGREGRREGKREKGRGMAWMIKVRAMGGWMGCGGAGEACLKSELTHRTDDAIPMVGTWCVV